MNWISKNWQLVVILGALAWFIYNFYTSTPADALMKHLKLENDSLKHANEEIQVKRDLEKVKRAEDSVKIASAEVSIDSLNDIQTKNKADYEETSSFIYNSTDSVFVGYLSKRQVPAGYTQ